MIGVLTVHVLVAAAAAILGQRLGRRVMLVGALAPLASLVWLLMGVGAVLEGRVSTTEISWVPDLGVDLSLRLDGLGALMVLLVGAIGCAIFVYGWRYFAERDDLGRFTAYLVGFAGSMFGLVVADNLLVLFSFWELTSITSYLLIGFEDRSAGARSGALQALLVTAGGGLAMLAGIVLVAQEAGSYSMSAIVADPPVNTAVGAGLGLILLGAFTKSAQFPFHFWLPGAMSAPTPVSAYLHSATMVKAGIYLVARLAFAFAPAFFWWRPVVVTVGLVTMLVGGWRALSQHDLKLILAQGTVSQLGFIMVLVGFGIPAVTFAGMAMILAHAVFKAALFMTVGIVDHQAHTRDIRRLDGLGRRLPATAGVAAVVTASMIGLPPLLGFVAKESALESLLHVSGGATAGVVLGSILTTAYGLRYFFGAFGSYGTDPADETVGTEVPHPTWPFLLAPALLALVSLVGGLFPALEDGLVGAAAEAVATGASEEHLALWHGFGMPLLLSALAIGAGLLVWKRPLRTLHRLTRRLPEATAVYSASIKNLNRLADRVTGVVQNGSLPIYLGVIITTAIVVPGAVLIRHWFTPDIVVLTESPWQALTATLVIVAALWTTVVQRRLAAVLSLGAVGYGVAVLFVIQGAPDLALTQLLIETLTLALFVMVLRHLPDQFENIEWKLRQVNRLIISVLTGLTAGAFGFWAAAGRVDSPLIGRYMTLAEPEGGGRNVVNVILTDFRGFDTLGEITVLTVVALGAVALIRAGRDDGDRLLSPEMTEDDR